MLTVAPSSSVLVWLGLVEQFGFEVGDAAVEESVVRARGGEAFGQRGVVFGELT